MQVSAGTTRTLARFPGEAAGRVREACRRVVDAEKSGEYIRETRLDFITQAKRGKNPHAKECPGFTVKFRERDALLPEVMLFCR